MSPVPPQLVDLAFSQAKLSAASKNLTQVSNAAATMLGMLLQESGGLSICSTDMRGRRGFPTFDWTSTRAASARSAVTQVKIGYTSTTITQDSQTNYGLLQTSHDIFINKSDRYEELVTKFLKIVQGGDASTARRLCRFDDFFSAGDLFGPLKGCTVAGMKQKSGRACWAHLAMACPVFNWQIAAKKFQADPTYFQSRASKKICQSQIEDALKQSTKLTLQESEMWNDGLAILGEILHPTMEEPGFAPSDVGPGSKPSLHNPEQGTAI